MRLEPWDNSRGQEESLRRSRVTIAKTWKQPKCPLTDKWIKKMWYTHAHTHMLEYYSAIKKSMMPFAATRMDLESMVLSEISQTKINTI